MEVEADLHPCFACGSRLVLSTNVRADCVNPACIGGRIFALCGFCKKYSFSVAQSICFNPNCRLYKTKRTICPICNKMSVITYHGRPICINRSCESNRKIVTTCFFCGNASFLKSPGAMFCTKGDCPRLLQTIAECFACKQLSFVQSESKCKNPSCKYFDIELTQCSSCRQISFVVASNHPHSHKCINPNCSLYYEKAAKPIPTDQVRREHLGKMLQDTMAIPIEELQKQQQSISAPVPSAEPERIGKMFESGTVGDTLSEKSPLSEPEPKREVLPEVVEEAKGKEKEESVRQPLSKSPSEPEPIPVEDFSIKPGVPKTPHPEVQPLQAQPFQTPSRMAPSPKTPVPPMTPSPQPIPSHEVPAPEIDFGGETLEVKQQVPSKKVEPQEEDIAGRLLKELSEEQPLKSEAEVAPSPTASKKTPEPIKKPGDSRPVIREQMVETDSRGGKKDMVEPIQKDEEWEMESSSHPEAPSRFASIPQEVPPISASTFTIEDIYKFVEERIMRKDDGGQHPLFLVIGLPGSGKTTYLTMLGGILLFQNTIFHFPYRNLSPGLVNVGAVAKSVFGKSASLGQKQIFIRALEQHIVDLVASFAQDNFNRFIRQRLFPPQTPPSVSDRITGTFLISDLQKAGRSVARIATLEVSGEDVKEVLKQIRETEPEKVLKTPEQRVFYKMLNKATGFIILIDPSSAENDSIYNDFFWVLEEVMLSRFKKRLSELVFQRLRRNQTSKVTERLQLDDVMEILEHVEREQKKVELAAAERQRLKEQYQHQLNEVIAEMKGRGAEKVITDKKWKDFLGELDSLLFAGAFPEQRKSWRDTLNEKIKQLKNPQEQRALLALYLSSVADFCLKYVNELIDRQPEEVVRRLNEQMRRAEVERAKKEVFEEYQIDPEFEFHISTTEGTEEPQNSERFTNLKFISMVITKSDTNRIVYPPENFAVQKMPLSSKHLEKVQQYLKLFGGYVRYYNASVAGYTVMMDTTSYIGPECTLTPTNVLEPVFDMLEAEGII